MNLGVLLTPCPDLDSYAEGWIALHWDLFDGWLTQARRAQS